MLHQNLCESLAPWGIAANSQTLPGHLLPRHQSPLPAPLSPRPSRHGLRRTGTPRAEARLVQRTIPRFHRRLARCHTSPHCSDGILISAAFPSASLLSLPPRRRLPHSRRRWCQPLNRPRAPASANSQNSGLSRSYAQWWPAHRAVPPVSSVRSLQRGPCPSAYGPTSALSILPVWTAALPERNVSLGDTPVRRLQHIVTRYVCQPFLFSAFFAGRWLMKAIVFHQHGDPGVLHYTDVNEPHLRANEVLVRVHACALNHLDLWVRRGLPGVPIPLPHIPGSDVAGEVAKVGAEVHIVHVGQKVVLAPGVTCGKCPACLSGNDNHCRDYTNLGYMIDGGCAEFVRCPEVNCLPYPENLDWVHAAAVPLVFQTAWHMLVTRAQLQPGESVLVLAAGSGVGSAAVQIAKFF